MESFKINKPPKDLEKYVTNLHTFLIEQGYKKYNQDQKSSDFQYWKVFDGYQVGILVYDFRKYPDLNRISISYECMLIDIDCRIDLCVNKNIELDEFEEMSREFYSSMIKYK